MQSLPTMMTAVFAAGVVAASNVCADRPSVGDPAPPLQISEYLQAPEDANASWEHLRGNVVIVEFWATWCGPCIAAIPHLNELAEEFKDEPVQFIAISNEDAAPVERFLERREMKAWVVLDDERQTFSAYGVTGIPHTVLVDPEGKIAAITHPNSLKAEHIEQVLAGEKPDLPERGGGMGFTITAGIAPDDDSDEPPLFQVSIRRHTGDGGGGAVSGDAMTLHGYSVADLVRTAWRVTASRLDMAADLGENKYTLVARVPRERRDELLPLVRRAIELTFGISATFEKRHVPVFVLTVPDDSEHKLEAAVEDAGRTMSSGPGTLSLIGMPLSSLTQLLEHRLNLPVLDETGLDGRFDIHLRFSEESRNWSEEQRAEEFRNVVREQLGLELSRAEREIDMLVIRLSDN